MKMIWYIKTRRKKTLGFILSRRLEDGLNVVISVIEKTLNVMK